MAAAAGSVSFFFTRVGVIELLNLSAVSSAEACCLYALVVVRVYIYIRRIASGSWVVAGTSFVYKLRANISLYSLKREGACE